MTKAAVKEVVDRELEPWMRRLGVPHWRVTVEYGRCAHDHWSAQCVRDCSYEQASITLDPAQHDSEEDVVRSLIHELAHIVLWPFDLYRDLMNANVEKGSTMDEVEERAWLFAVELGVKAIRRLVHGMGGPF